MSRETTEARGESNASAAAWRSHVTGCFTCAAAIKAKRTRYGLCDDGAVLRDKSRHDAAELERQRLLDAKPITGQESLF